MATHVFDLDSAQAYAYYHDLILGYIKAKSIIYATKGFSTQGSVPSKDWEVFGAILMKDQKKKGYGADLERHEIKSSSGTSFEYQYHRNHGLDKIEEDKHVDHVFIVYSPDYLNIQVWWVAGKQLIEIFNGWQQQLREAYGNTNQQRFRKSIPIGLVHRIGCQILEIRDGELYDIKKVAQTSFLD
jgi:hypothetical protein